MIGVLLRLPHEPWCVLSGLGASQCRAATYVDQDGKEQSVIESVESGLVECGCWTGRVIAALESGPWSFEPAIDFTGLDGRDDADSRLLDMLRDPRSYFARVRARLNAATKARA